MKKTLITVFLVMVSVSMVYASQKEAYLKLPVRVLSGNKVVENLLKDDFNLRTNGQKVEIVEFFENNRSLLKRDLPRIFVLTFNITEYEQQITDGIVYFVENILEEGDSLFVWSPVKMYLIDSGGDKKSIGENIKEIVKKDTLQYKSDIARATGSLDEIIRKYQTDNRMNEENQISSASKRTIAQFFLSNYSRELKDFMKKFILTRLMNIRDAAQLLAEKDGEKWIINFQDREIIPNMVIYNEIAAQISDIAASLSGNDMANATRMYTVLNMIGKILLVSESLPMQEITDALLAANISYNAILFKSAKKSITIGDSVSPDLDGTIKHISELSGGAAVVTSNLPEGLDIIRKHRDTYYDLIFKIDAGIEDKAVTVVLSESGANAYYKQLFTKKEIAAIFERLDEPGIKLTGFELKGQILKFSISDYKLAAFGNKDQGFIRVLVNLADDRDNVVYKTHKTLKSETKSTDVTLQLPSKYRGYYKIRVSAFDLVSNRSTQLNKYEKL